jgi:hypothetical protein
MTRGCGIRLRGNLQNGVALGILRHLLPCR